MSSKRYPTIPVSHLFVGKCRITATPVQRDAAWALYVELSTRIAVQGLRAENGSIREALNSLYKLFETTRSVLKEAGPNVADGPDSVGPLALKILNNGLRPFLAKWHTEFSKFELSQPTSSTNNQTNLVASESHWKDYSKFFKELRTLQKQLEKIVQILARIAGVSEK